MSDIATRADDEAIEPEAVAKAIDDHGREQAYDQVIVGYLLQIAHEVRHDGSREHGRLQRRISKLVGSLQPQTLERLLEMGGDAGQRRRFVLDAAQGMTVHAVVELVRAAATAEGCTISHSLVRMLTKLATHAASDMSARSRAADERVSRARRAARRIVVARRSEPGGLLGHAVAALAGQRVPQRRRRHRRSTACEPARLISMALEIGHRGPAGLERRGGDARPGRDRRAARSARRRATADGRRGDRSVDADPRARYAAPTCSPHRGPTHRDPPARGAHRSGAAPSASSPRSTICPEGGRQERLLISYLVQIGTDGRAGRRDAPRPTRHPARARAAGLPREARARRRRPARCSSAASTPTRPVRREAVKLLLGYASAREATMLTALRDRGRAGRLLRAPRRGARLPRRGGRGDPPANRRGRARGRPGARGRHPRRRHPARRRDAQLAARRTP